MDTDAPGNTVDPVAVDTELYWLDRRLAPLIQRRNQIQQLVRYYADRPTRDEQDKLTHEHRLAELQTELEPLLERHNALERVFEATLWSRYWLVLNTNGHAHRDRSCSTCRPSTRFSRLPQYSGTTENVFIADAGELACTACFPDAPVDRPTTIEDPEQKAQREERAAEKARKDAEKQAKGITSPDGSPLHEVGNTRDGGWRETANVVKTERAASNAALSAAFDLLWYGNGHPQAAAWAETIRRNTEALAHKRGTTIDHEKAQVDKKSQAKYRRETR